MAQMLKLVRGFDGTADQDTLDLLSYTQGISPAYEGWTPRTPVGGEEEVIETITMRVKGTSHDDLAAVVQDVAQFAEYAKWYQDSPVEKFGVWLRAKLDGESSARQAWVKQLDHGMAASVYSRALNEKYHMNSYVLQARRMPYWEGTAVDTLVNNQSVYTIGGTYHYGAITGDTHARVSYLTIDCGTLSNTRRFWMGFKTDRFGGLADYQSVIPLGAGGYIVNADGTVARTANAYAYTGAMLQFKFAAGEAENLYWRTPTQYGRYLVLLRAAASEKTPYVRARLWTANQGLDTTKKQYKQWVPITWESNTANTLSGFKYFEMGIIQVPGAGRTVNGSEVYRTSTYGNIMGVQIDRYSGSAEWVGLDAIVYIPADEGYIKTNLSETSFGSIEYTIGTASPPSGKTTMEVAQYPDGDLLSYETIVESGNHIPVLTHDSIVEGGVPPGTGMFVIAVDNLSSIGTAEYANVTIKTVKRWKELRGAE